MKTLITASEAIALAFADSGFLPTESISPSDIAAAEARFLLPITGRRLWDRLLEGDYLSLRADYAAPAAAQAVRLTVQPALDIRAGQGGTVTPYGTMHHPAAHEQLRAARRAVRARLNTLLKLLSEHLNEAASDYPEYDPDENVLNRIDTASGMVLPHRKN